METNKRMNVFDLTKYILSLMVVSIHSNLYPMVIYPWVRLAVPLFFIISSYFFFSGLNQAFDNEERTRKLWKYIKRNARLYIFWFIVLLPYTLYIRNYFAEGVWMGMFQFIKSLLFKSTFPASWYIQASIIAVSVIFFVSKKISNFSLFVISSLIYVVVILRSSYFDIVEINPFLNRFYVIYESIFCSPVFNASAAFIWIVIGKYFAENKIKIDSKVSAIGFFISCGFLYGEWTWVRAMNGAYNNDCYFFLLPAAVFAFEILRKIEIAKNKLTVFLGKSSIIIYVTHIPMISVLSYIYNSLFSIRNVVFVFASTIIICTVLSYVIFRLEKYSAFRWLKYSH